MQHAIAGKMAVATSMSVLRTCKATGRRSFERLPQGASKFRIYCV